MRITILGLAMLVAGPVFAFEPEDSIATDRPDVVESSAVVGKGRFQLEASVAGERFDHDGVREVTHSTPTLLRFGLTDATELRFETDGRMNSGAAGRGYSDWSVGVKWHFADAAGSRPSMALLAHADVDSGSPAYRGSGVRPSLRLSAEWELADDWSFGVMPGVLLDRREDGGRFASGIFAVTLGKEINDRLRGFVELAAPSIASARNGGTNAAFDFGAAWLLTNNAQLDMAFSRGLNHTTPKLGWTAGLSIKF